MKRKIKYKEIHPQLRLIGAAARLVLSPVMHEKVLIWGNRFMDRFIKGCWPGRKSRIEERYIPRADGTELRIVVCTSRHVTSEKATGLLWVHGGGYAIGLPEQDFLFVDPFVADGSTVAVMPNYRKTGEAPYPAALEDCYLALVWMKEHAAELGINPDQLFVGGNSAGGGMTVALALYARDKGEVKIAFQMPLYPMLDDRMENRSAKNNDAPVWDSKKNEAAWKLYLRGLMGDEQTYSGCTEAHSDHEDTKWPLGDVPIYAAPARAEDCSGLPPMCTYVGSIEPFLDETVEYARKLHECGIPVHLRVYKGCFHAFDQSGCMTRIGKNARDYRMRVYHYAQNHYFAKQ